MTNLHVEIAWMVAIVASAGAASIDAPAHGRACQPHPWDGMSAAAVCEVAAAGMIASGVDPADPFDWSVCRVNGGPGCRSNLAELMRFLRCESWLHPDAYDEGWVGVDWHGEPVWNRSRGIGQIGDGWEHLATDEQAFDWRWSVWFFATDLERMETYPECGPDGSRA